MSIINTMGGGVLGADCYNTGNSGVSEEVIKIKASLSQLGIGDNNKGSYLVMKGVGGQPDKHVKIGDVSNIKPEEIAVISDTTLSSSELKKIEKEIAQNRVLSEEYPSSCFDGVLTNIRQSLGTKVVATLLSCGVSSGSVGQSIKGLSFQDNQIEYAKNGGDNEKKSNKGIANAIGDYIVAPAYGDTISSSLQEELQEFNLGNELLMEIDSIIKEMIDNPGTNSKSFSKITKGVDIQLSKGLYPDTLELKIKSMYTGKLIGFATISSLNSYPELEIDLKDTNDTEKSKNKKDGKGKNKGPKARISKGEATVDTTLSSGAKVGVGVNYKIDDSNNSNNSNGTSLEMTGVVPGAWDSGIGTGLEYGEDITDLIPAIGAKVGQNGEIILLGRFLSTNDDYSVPELIGNKKKQVNSQVNQAELHMYYKHKLRDFFIKCLDSVEFGLKGKSSSTDKEKLENMEIILDKGAFYEITNITNGVGGAYGTGVSTAFTFKYSNNITIKFTIEADHISRKETGENDLDLGVRGIIRFKDVIENGDSFGIGAKIGTMTSNARANYEYPIGKGWYTNSSVNYSRNDEGESEILISPLTLEYHFNDTTKEDITESKRNKKSKEYGLGEVKKEDNKGFDVVSDVYAKIREVGQDDTPLAKGYRKTTTRIVMKEIKPTETQPNPENPDGNFENLPKSLEIKSGETYNLNLGQGFNCSIVEGGGVLDDVSDTGLIKTKSGILTKGVGKIKVVKNSRGASSETKYVDITVNPITVTDTEPPVTSINLLSVTETTASININTNEAGTGYYIVKLASEGAPSKQDLLTSGININLSAGNNTINLSSLVKGTDYKLYFVAKDVKGNIQNGVSNTAFKTTNVQNNAPTANAGADVTILAGQSVTLNGTGNDIDGTIVAYEWSTESGTVLGTAQSLVVTPASTTTYRLRVKDNSGNWSLYDGVVVLVTSNNIPVANAGGNKSIILGQSVTLNGSGTDSDGTIVAYEWNTGATTASITVNPTVTTTYTLRVRDNSGNWSAVNSATVTVTSNNIPVANAGGNKSITLGQSVTLNGSGTDSDGTIVAYEWNTGATTASITVSPTVTTTYTLRVRDNSGNWSPVNNATVTVDSAPPENNLPTANAGEDKSIDSGQSVTLNGSGADSDGTIVAYEWSNGATTASITVSPTVTTTYTLRVKDDKGAWSSNDSVTVTVNSAPPENNIPTANAGGDVTIDSGESTTLNGSGTDSDGTIVAYEWSNGATTASITVSPTTTTTYTLRVKDDKGAWSATDSVTVTVNSAPPENEAPVAGNDSVAGGQGTGILSYNFSSIVTDDKPISQLSFSFSCSETTLTTSGTFPNITFHTDGVYAGDATVSYTVTDAEGLSASGTLQIIDI